MSVTYTIVKIKTALQRAPEMYALFCRYYANVKYADFITDLREKQDVILLTDSQTGGIVGFSTLMVIDPPDLPITSKVIFSGDTIVDITARNSLTLAKAWLRYAFTIRDAIPEKIPLYWFLVSKGFRTYRFLSVYFKTFYPAMDGFFADLKPIMDRIAWLKFGDAYRETSGIIYHGPHQQKLLNDFDLPSSLRITDPHTAFFLARNPGHIRGDELCCLCSISRENMTATGLRFISSIPKEIHENCVDSSV